MLEVQFLYKDPISVYVLLDAWPRESD